MPVLVSGKAMAEKYYSRITPEMNRLIRSYWPGSLTIIADFRRDRIYAPIRGGGSTVGLRMPDNAELLNMILHTRVPVLGPSANFHGLPTPFSEKDLDPQLVKLADWVIPGICRLRQVSTVVRISGGKTSLIRDGAVKISI
jgi:L-threonylcarbamoyladenylate synthase